MDYLKIKRGIKYLFIGVCFALGIYVSTFLLNIFSNDNKIILIIASSVFILGAILEWVFQFVGLRILKHTKVKNFKIASFFKTLNLFWAIVFSVLDIIAYVTSKTIYPTWLNGFNIFFKLIFILEMDIGCFHIEKMTKTSKAFSEINIGLMIALIGCATILKFYGGSLSHETLLFKIIEIVEGIAFNFGYLLFFFMLLFTYKGLRKETYIK